MSGFTVGLIIKSRQKYPVYQVAHDGHLTIPWGHDRGCNWSCRSHYRLTTRRM